MRNVLEHLLAPTTDLAETLGAGPDEHGRIVV